MEEKKNKQGVVNGNNGGNGNNQGGRRRRNRNHHHRGGNGGNGNQNAQAQNQPQSQNAQAQEKPNKPQQNGGKQKHKNKQGNNQNQPAPQQQQPKNNNQGTNNKEQSVEKKEENRKDTYAYVLDGNLYINLTNKCSNGCDFCVRNERASYYGNYLWLRNGDPSAEAVIAQVRGMGDLSRFKEVVFCGFGEPTYKVKEMIELCDYFHEKGLSTRLNTNGQGNLINKRDIVPELKGKIDFVNVSLNASCAEKYQPICRSQYGENGFAALVEFAKICKRNGVNCRFSIVDCIGEDEVEACKRLAASVNIPLYVRAYIADS